MTRTAPHVAEILDAALGDATDEANIFGFHEGLVRDEAGEFPEAFRAEVADRAGLHLGFLPRTVGGTGVPLDAMMLQVRVAARRDLAVMPAAMFSITAATCVVLAGSVEQVRRVVALLDAGTPVAFALSEPAHGADVVSGQCRAALDSEGEDPVRLDGEKWMVGLGHRAGAAYVVARTGERGPAAFSGFLLSADDLAAVRSHSEPIVCMGMRGIDFARYEFRGLEVPRDRLVGEAGRGLEVAMRALQVVRIVGSAANLACTDSALRLTHEYGRSREVAGKPLLDHPRPRRAFATAISAHLAADVASVVAGRALQVCPPSVSHWSGVVKRVVTDATDTVVRQCGDLLGTWSVVREGVGALFDKVRRDAEVLRYVDTGPEATSRVLSGQIPALLRNLENPSAGARERVEAVHDLGAEPPDYDPTELRMASRGPDDVLSVFATDEAHLLRSVPDELVPWIEELARKVSELRLVAITPGVDLVEVADTFAALHGAASAVHLWRLNQDRSLYGTEPGSTVWLRAVFTHLFAIADRAWPRLADDLAEGIAASGRSLIDGGALLTMLPVRLAEAKTWSPV
ncbi:acyl-CoA dehydrogenase [Saccharopolyspora sp. NPDC050389]|uniref:acyl-CoA dehydrogenase family protein n=1 Tax=Saccharopolyspora sp. NPDC050389 TaxID=3155516 RepID=UPI0033E96843